MTREQAKQWIPILQAYSEGKIVEFKGKDHTNWTNEDYYCFNEDPSEYRIKPESKLRPWKPEEVPVGALIRGSHYGVRVIQGYGRIRRDLEGSYVFYYGLQEFTGDSLETCLHDREHSLDGGKTWLPCGVEEYL